MKKKKNNTKRSMTKKINFHSVPKFHPLFATVIQIPRLLEDHRQ
jgi:hypothetical protein